MEVRRDHQFPSLLPSRMSNIVADGNFFGVNRMHCICARMPRSMHFSIRISTSELSCPSAHFLLLHCSSLSISNRFFFGQIPFTHSRFWSYRIINYLMTIPHSAPFERNIISHLFHVYLYIRFNGLRVHCNDWHAHTICHPSSRYPPVFVCRYMFYRNCG